MTDNVRAIFICPGSLPYDIKGLVTNMGQYIFCLVGHIKIHKTSAQNQLNQM